MEYIAEIHSLSAKFFTDYPHSQYPEIAVKKNRPYSCLLIEYMDDLFICIPFRSHIRHPHAYHFKSSARSQRSQSGLDLGVIDHYNGTRRSVKTLSGGESFKASLALALGLSDEVQSAAGGIRLDTLFLDEGFGSLDDESLEQAIRVLAGLTEGDRLVGIISHVAALKERIDKQVVVKKARSGGSTVEVIV